LAQLRQQLGASLDRQEKSLVQLSDRVGRQVGSPSTGPGRSQGASAAEFEGAFGGEEPSTSVYASEDTAVQWTPESSNSDETRTEREHSEVDETSSTRLARLERQQRELRGELEERKAYIDELEERLDADDSSDATDGADSSEASSEVETEHAPNADEPES
ncbi:MAG: hypothetical protein ABEL76_03965, partial [Bradymonadaceae bacterium]